MSYEKHEIFEKYIISLAALVCAVAIFLISILGPLGLNILSYRVSSSAETQLIGQDLVNLILVAPICLIGGILHLKGNPNSKFFLILVGIYAVFYTGLAYGIGQEWSNPSYTGNTEQFFYLYYAIIISGLIIFMSSLTMFTEEDAPDFNPRSLKIYVTFLFVFLILFALMWLGQIMEIVSNGDTSEGIYIGSETVFWVVRYFDLGISIPIGFISTYLLLTRTKKAYPLILAFFGFFVTTITAVLAMALVMILNNDPSVQPAELIIFPVLGILSYSGFFYLIKSKLPFFKEK